MKILISAYACEPERGSEPGAGWHWAFAAARSHDVWVMTRANNRGRIEGALSRSDEPAPRFVYVDLPRWAGFWKRKGRGIRTYYFLWQLVAGLEARRLHRRERFDLVHHVTFANAFQPALACLARAPFVLGPVGGGQRVPLRLYPLLGARAAAVELLLRAARRLAALNPLVRIAWARAAVIVVQNDETRDALPARHRAKVLFRPHAVVPATLRRPAEASPQELVAVCAGRLNRFKGTELALRALAAAPRWRLVLIGRGPDERRLRALAERLGVADRVRFVPWLPQEELWRELASCTVLLFPSLKEGAPFVVAEAHALGLPVIALDIAGTRVYRDLVGSSLELVGGRSRAECAAGVAAALRRLEHGRPPVAGADFSPAAVARDLEPIYRRALDAPPAAAHEATA